MNLFDIFESQDDELFAESPITKAIASLHAAKKRKQNTIVRMKRNPEEYSAEELAAKEKALEGIDLIAQALKRGGAKPAAMEWHRFFYAKAYSGEPGAPELADEGLELASSIKDNAGINFFNLSLSLTEDDMFAMPWRTKVANLLQKLLDSPARQRSAEIEPDDIDNIKLLVDALQKNNINQAKALWDRFSWNELDNALYLYIERIRPDIDLFELLGNEEDLDEGDDMFAEENPNKRLARLMWRDGYDLGSLSVAGIRAELENYPELAAQIKAHQGGDSEANMWDVFDDIIYEFEELEQRGRYMGESEDDMFAQKKQADLTKISTPKLIEFLHLYKQYPELKSDSTRIKVELKRRGAQIPYGFDDLDESEDDMFAQGKQVPTYLKPFIGHPIIGSARIARDVANRIDWRDEWQVDDLDQLPLEWYTFFTKAGETVPVIDLNDQGTIAIIYIMPGFPLRVFTKHLADIRVDHPTAIDESEDDMFASAFRIERDVMEWTEQAGVNYQGLERVKGLHSHKEDNIVYMYVLQKDGRCTGVYYSPQPATVETNIGTYNLRFQGGFEDYLRVDPNNPAKNVTEETDDDMFAGPRRDSRLDQIIELLGAADAAQQRGDAQEAIAALSEADAAQQSMGTMFPAALKVHNKLEDFISQLESSDWDSYYIHNGIEDLIEMYFEDDELDESDDELFAPSSLSKALPQIIEDLHYISEKMVDDPLEYIEGDMAWDMSDLTDDEINGYIEQTIATGETFRELEETFRNSGIAGGVAKLVTLRNDPNEITRESVVFILDELYDVYDVDVKKFMAEEDDMFASTTQAETIGNQLIRYGNVLLKIGAERNLENVSIEGDLIVKTGEVFKRNGLEAGVRVYRTLGDKPKQDIQSLFQEVLGINVDELIKSMSTTH